MCNRDCFNCTYDDCVDDRISVPEYEAIKDECKTSAKERERVRKYRQEHKLERNAYNKRYNQEHSEEMKAYISQWKKDNPCYREKQRIYLNEWRRKRKEQKDGHTEVIQPT